MNLIVNTKELQKDNVLNSKAKSTNNNDLFEKIFSNMGSINGNNKIKPKDSEHIIKIPNSVVIDLLQAAEKFPKQRDNIINTIKEMISHNKAVINKNPDKINQLTDSSLLIKEITKSPELTINIDSLKKYINKIEQFIPETQKQEFQLSLKAIFNEKINLGEIKLSDSNLESEKLTTSKYEVNLSNTTKTDNTNRELHIRDNNFKEIEIDISVKKHPEKSDNAGDSIDIFSEIKKRKQETKIEHYLTSEQTSQIGPTNNSNNWDSVSVKKGVMPLDNWFDTFKEEIDKLTDFRIDNKQKVMMFLKEQDDRLRIIVEKTENSIQITATVSENMRDKLESILSEVQLEMKETDILIEIEIHEEQNEERDNDEEQSEHDDQKQKNQNHEEEHEDGNKQ